MKKFVIGTFLAIIFSGCIGCSSINTVFDGGDSTTVKPSSNAAAEREFEKHDIYKPWWSK